MLKFYQCLITLQVAVVDEYPWRYCDISSHSTVSQTHYKRIFGDESSIKKIAEADVLVQKMCKKKFVLVESVDFIESIVMPFTCPLFITLTNTELQQQQGT